MLIVNELKQILLKLSQLSKIDQHWVLRKLPPSQRKTFEKLQGNRLLKQSRRFRRLKTQVIPHVSAPQFPNYCQTLALETPLYIAIILEQEQFPWKKAFLNIFDVNHQIQDHCETTLCHVKPATKTIISNCWKNALSFADHLESNHG